MFKCRGRLRHSFHGIYACTISLIFDDESDAEGAKFTLGNSWEFGQNTSLKKRGLIWAGSSDELKDIKNIFKGFSLMIHPCGWRHCKKQCSGAEIDSLAHSVDVGPEFTLEIPSMVDSNQVELFI